MAMPASASVAMVVVAASASVAMVVMATSAATTRQVLDKMLYLFIGGLAVLDHLTSKLQGLTCQWVVRVYRHAVFLNLHHLRHEALVILTHQGDDGSLEDVLMVEMTVDREYVALQLMLSLGDILSKSLFGLEGEVEGRAFLLLLQLLFEGVEGGTEACDKLKRALCTRLLLESTLSVDHCIQLINDGEESVFLLIHTLLYILFLIFAAKLRKFSEKASV